MSYAELKAEAQERFDKSIQHLTEMLRGIRTGRASSALVDNIRVEYYGTPTPISQMASVSCPEPRQIIIKPFDATILKDMAKAIMKSDLGTNPQDDGKVLRLNLPALSGEQRTKYVGKVKGLCEEARVAMRNGRRDLNKQADAMRKSSELTEDENRKLHDEIQELLKTSEKRVEDIQERKVTEIMDI